MGTIHIDLFTTLDLVGQAPGGRDEDPDGFPYGGWQFSQPDQTVGEHVIAGILATDALLLGRRTYDIFAGYWPHQDDVIAERFNSIPKYVASHGSPTLDWAGTSQLGPDLPAAVRELRDKHDEVHVIGSLNLVQTLLRERLFDRLNLWVYPLVLGVGKKVFDGGAVPTSLTLAEPPITSDRGAVLLRYTLGDPITA